MVSVDRWHCGVVENPLDYADDWDLSAASVSSKNQSQHSTASTSVMQHKNKQLFSV